ncbi:hypothetical protein [Pseudomonas sp. Marseille-Q5115]|uniref:hypothetical protein n=1 Tax=Pseudomonas sp. Marseille-Q5115 TaxID=2866593 RepID=UPI001CE3E612|nr:hypothetical protein [Pseudomonas sp. Marseille-Q5115]
MAQTSTFRSLIPTKAERSSAALCAAAREAELKRKWFSAAELYEAAASILPCGAVQTSANDMARLVRKAEQCRQQIPADSDLAEMDDGFDAHHEGGLH